MTDQPEPEPSIIYIGARVTYHGSLRSQHGRAFLVFPCTWFGGRCAGCDDDREADAPTRYTLHDPQTGDAIHHVRPTSITPHPHRWPSDAMPMRIGPYTYMASHATPGGSQYSRTVHFHTADGLGRTWARVNPNDDTIRQLDRQGRGLAA